MAFNAFKSVIFPLPPSQGIGLKMLAPKQMPQRIPIALTQVKAANTCENLLKKSFRLYILCIGQKKLLRKFTAI